MDLYLALAVAGVCVVIAAICAWRDSRPPGLNPRIIPWRFLMLVAGVGALFAGVQALGALGITLPQNQMGAP